MTHQYTLLLGGRVVAAGHAGATAIAWAADTILAIGSDDEVRGISRGDSHVIELRGATVAPLREGPGLEVGAPARLAILPSSSSRAEEALAIVQDGRVTSGSLMRVGRRIAAPGGEPERQAPNGGGRMAGE
jgi:hypothetical protein